MKEIQFPDGISRYALLGRVHFFTCVFFRSADDAGVRPLDLGERGRPA